MKQVEVEREQARLLLARLLFVLKKDVRRVTFWALLQGLMTVTYVVLLAALLSSTIGSAATPSELIWLAFGLIATLVVRGLSFYQQEKCALQLALKSEQQALSWLAQGWQYAAGRGVVRDQASLVGEPMQVLGPYFSRYRPQLSLAVIVPLIILSVVFYLDWIAGTFLLLSAPLIPVFMALVGMGADRVNQQHFALMRRISGLFIDRLRNVTVLKLFNQTEQAQDEVRRASEKSHQLNMKTLRVAFLSSAVLEFFTAVAIAAVAIYVGFALLGYYQIGPASRMTWFTGLTVLMLAPEFFQPLRTLSSYYHDRAAAVGAAAELARFGLQLNEVDSKQELRPLQVDGQLVVTELTVRYEGRGIVLKNVSFTAKPGQLIWISGASGAGKSTLLKSLAGLLEVEAELTRDLQFRGRMMTEQAVAYLAQTPFIGNQRLADNLRLAAPQATDSQLEDVLNQVGLNYLLQELPEGLGTFVGTQGTALSGGEGRRVAIARVLLSKAQLVLLDEPTAGLDEESALEVMHAINCLLEANRTVIVASHDALLADWAAQAFELKEGQLHEA
ncbi:thiol reductant ABC exporter subunit CydD [Aliidiomarina taiwanensis]|uniref:Thiol reductant ABC exporter subunit CydD n=1 Tax=Aliidiomarina taiwanensis TaxID=946228 RepID=A0A432X9C7_9GAMM|nr:thiol reductant ABC exporter subunit CydD [Aliidiomarina taiwanensis]RUO43998.1 thiol reductant ABC exporter subunit CydD [Aliidiomarina taiwanensis]